MKTISILINSIVVFIANGIEYAKVTSNDLENGSMLITPKQLSMILKNSNISHDITMDTLRSCNGGLLNIEAEYRKAGSVYICDENSTAVKSGKCKVGEQAVKESDGYILGDTRTATIVRSLQSEMVVGAVNTIANKFLASFDFGTKLNGTKTLVEAGNNEVMKESELSV